LRLLQEDNLLCVRRRKFLLGTTDSRHGLPIYANVAAGMVLTRIDQLWVADITYIRLQWEFVYLAVVLDAFSRRCLGWALQRSLEFALVLEALPSGQNTALSARVEIRLFGKLHSVLCMGAKAANAETTSECWAQIVA
jgi:hypothetical protein